jgi:hypothetical protein
MAKACDQCKKLEALVEAQASLICWYGDDHDPDDGDTKGLIEAEHAIDKARSELRSFGERLIGALVEGVEAIRDDKKLKKTVGMTGYVIVDDKGNSVDETFALESHNCLDKFKGFDGTVKEWNQLKKKGWSIKEATAFMTVELVDEKKGKNK